jgi:hypothetical protein
MGVVVALLTLPVSSGGSLAAVAIKDPSRRTVTFDTALCLSEGTVEWYMLDPVALATPLISNSDTRQHSCKWDCITAIPALFQ